ncbi:hypothetical protein IEQ34_020290 [Dendrobium chrysotoxum]|uniref:Uncharacterized protein n=1 Tax=Dendrobium chrysotoxum TaxID=161865 RepID=A0AAV7G257_DENCH|nr:hypothetical protein IEQ34_020290 [Dendrobium chrysotoxum]
MKDLPASLHVHEEDIMRILKVSDIEHLLFEVRHMSRYTEEEFLFKVGLSFHAGRSDAKIFQKVHSFQDHHPGSRSGGSRPYLWYRSEGLGAVVY